MEGFFHRSSIQTMSDQSSDEKPQEFGGNDFDSPTNKRMKEMPIDRLSALPDGILIHILSFLSGVEESAVTSVLSKRWEFIWAELPRLEFCEYSKNSEKRRQFVAKVNRTLLIRTGIHLEEFEVYFRYDESFASDVDSWLDFVLKHKAKDVGLLLNEAKIAIKHYALPETMYSNSSLTRFSVGGCLMGTLTKIEWPSLARLCIENSELSQHVVDKILSDCPVLHTLDLVECWGFNCLDVKSQNLCKLWVKDCENRENGPLLEIAAPYLHTLDLWFNHEGRMLVLRNIKSLSGAEIDFLECWSTSYDVVLSTTMELFEILKDVNELKLGLNYLKVLSELVADGLQLPVSRRKSLTVTSFIGDEHSVSCIFALLRFSPNLERLSIDFDHEGETWDKAAQGDLDCDLLHLKTVEICDFGDRAFGNELMLTVARTLLMRATVLEEMKIKFRVEDKIGQTLLNYPRSSEKAVVRLHQL